MTGAQGIHVSRPKHYDVWQATDAPSRAACLCGDGYDLFCPLHKTGWHRARDTHIPEDPTPSPLGNEWMLSTPKPAMIRPGDCSCPVLDNGDQIHKGSECEWLAAGRAASPRVPYQPRHRRTMPMWWEEDTSWKDLQNDARCSSFGRGSCLSARCARHKPEAYAENWADHCTDGI